MKYLSVISIYFSSTPILKFWIGSTHTITPRQFIDDLKVLELGGTGSRAIPNGLREGRVEQRSYQEYYDEKYFTKDAPPPPRPAPTALPVPGEQRKLLRISPTNSFASSVNSTSTAKEEKKKKKGGLFRFS
jgi:syntaxin-binding protein 1